MDLDRIPRGLWSLNLKDQREILECSTTRKSSLNSYRRKMRKQKAFSLVECLMAVAIASFVLISLTGLMTINIKNDGNSQSEVDASNLISMLLCARRVIPEDQAALALPPLSEIAPGLDVKKSVFIDSYGRESTKQEKFKLDYEIRRDAQLVDLYRLRLKLIWPPPPEEKERRSLNELEVTSTIRQDRRNK